MKDLYQGFTLEELKALLDYDPDSGRFVVKKTGLVVTDNKLKVRNPEKKSVTLMLSRVAVWLVEEVPVEDDFVVKFKDSDPDNLAYDNLVVVAKCDSNKPLTDQSNMETATKGVFFLPKYNYFVVRRGPTQAVYRTFEYKEAIAIRKEWEKDKTIHRWDRTVPSHLTNLPTP